MIDFKKFAKAGKSKKNSAQLPSEVLDFMQTCHEQGVRVDYSGFTKVLGEAGALSEEASGVVIAGLRFINKLPIGLQYLVCKKTGSYNEEALSKWGDRVEESWLTRHVVQGNSARQLFKTWLAEGGTESEPEVEDDDTDVEDFEEDEADLTDD